MDPESPLDGPVAAAVLAAFPEAMLSYDGPSEAGERWLDITVGAKWLLVEWNATDGFGVARVIGNTGYGQYPNQRITDESEAIARVLELLA